MKENGKLQLALCGLGRFAQRRVLPILNECYNIELTAIIGKVNEGFNLENGGISVYNSLEDFLKTTPTGAVYITSPNFLHVSHSIACLRNGLHVLCEKPMATNSTDCIRMIQEAEKAGMNLQISQQIRHSPAISLAKSWIQADFIGIINDIKILFHYDLPVCNRKWVYDFDKAGGGCFIDAGIHCIDLVRFLTEDSINVIEGRTDRNQYEDMMERKALGTFHSGGINCSIDVNAITSYSTTLSISGSKGEIFINNFSASWGEVTVELYSEKQRTLVLQERVDVSLIYATQLKSFAEKVISGNTDYSGAIQSGENIKLIEEFYKKSSHFD